MSKLSPETEELLAKGWDEDVRCTGYVPWFGIHDRLSIYRRAS